MAAAVAVPAATAVNTAAAAAAVAVAAAATAAVAAAAAGGRQSHRAGWLEQNFDVLAVLSVFERFRAVLTFWNIFSRFGVFFGVFGWFWSVSDLGFGFGNNPRRQVFEETGIWRLHYRKKIRVPCLSRCETVQNRPKTSKNILTRRKIVKNAKIA